MDNEEKRENGWEWFFHGLAGVSDLVAGIISSTHPQDSQTIIDNLWPSLLEGFGLDLGQFGLDR